MTKSLSTWGIALTVCYLAFLSWLTLGKLETIRALALNEVGDFLAGAFGPLSILWLVLGFFQQSKELRQNSAALQLQAQELHNSVTQQADLAQTSKAQFDLAKAALEHDIQKQKDEEASRRKRFAPNFEFIAHYIPGTVSDNNQLGSHDICIINHGADCSNVCFSIAQTQAEVERRQELLHNAHWRLWLHEKTPVTSWPLVANISYQTPDFETISVEYYVHLDGETLLFTPVAPHS